MGGGGSSSSSSQATNQYDQSQNNNFENVGKAMVGSVDNSTQNYNYNLASDEALSGLSEALETQAGKTAEIAKTAKDTTNEIVNTLASSSKTNTILISIVASAALLGGGLILTRKKR